MLRIALLELPQNRCLGRFGRWTAAGLCVLTAPILPGQVLTARVVTAQVVTEQAQESSAPASAPATATPETSAPAPISQLSDAVKATDAGGVDALASGLSYKKVALKREQNETAGHLELNTVSQARCTFGDLDAIMLDLQNAGEPTALQISFEPLFSSVEQTAYAQPDQNRKRTATTFGTFNVDLPYSESPRVYGIYICSIPAANQNENQKPCSLQQLTSIEEAMSPYKVEVDKSINSEKPGRAPLVMRSGRAPGFKIYFFGYAIAHRDTLLIVDNPLEVTTYAKLTAYLKSVQADVRDFDALDAHLRKFNGRLTSMAPVARPGSLELILPFYDQKKCAG